MAVSLRFALLLFAAFVSFQLISASDDATVPYFLSLYLHLCVFALLLLVLYNLCLSYIYGSDDVTFQILYESFDESFEGRWIVSQKDEYKGWFPPLFFLSVLIMAEC